jgi:undecaprenyl pyrophosphate synthase
MPGTCYDLKSAAYDLRELPAVLYRDHLIVIAMHNERWARKRLGISQKHHIFGDPSKTRH